MAENQIRDEIIGLYTEEPNKFRYARVLRDDENLEPILHETIIPSENIRAESVSVDNLHTQIVNRLHQIEFAHLVRSLLSPDIRNVTETSLENLGNTVDTVFTDFVLSVTPNVVLWSFTHENEYRNQTNIPAGTNTTIIGKKVHALIGRGLENNIFIYQLNSINKFYPNNNRLIVNIIQEAEQTHFEFTIRQRLQIVNPDDIARIHVTN